MNRSRLRTLGVVTLAAFGVARCAASASTRRSSRRRPTSWPTNGGNWYNQRYSPLTEIDRSNVANLKGVWRTQLEGSGVGPQYSGEAQPLVVDGVIYVPTGASDLFALDVATGAILWSYRANLDPAIDVVCCGWTSRGVAHGDGRVYLGPARRQARRARREDGRRRVDRASRALARRLLDHERPALLRRPRDHGLLGRRARRARPRESVRRARRRARLDVLHDPGPRRARQRDLAARQRGLAARRRHRVAHAGRRSRARPHLLLDGQPGPRLQRRRAHGRQPLHVVDRRRRSEDRPNTAGTSSRCITTSGTSTARAPSCCSISTIDGRERKRLGAAEQDRLGLHPRSHRRHAARRHRRAARAAGAAPSDGRDATRTRAATRSCRSTSTSRPRAIRS